MNSLQALKKERNNRPVISLPSPEAGISEGLSAPSQASTPLPAPAAQAPAVPLSWPHFTPQQSPVPHRPCLEGLLCPQLSPPLPPCASRGWRCHLRAMCSQRVGATGRLGAASQLQAGASIPAGRSQEMEPECGRQAVSLERGRKPGQVSTATALARGPPGLPKSKGEHH